MLWVWLTQWHPGSSSTQWGDSSKVSIQNLSMPADVKQPAVQIALWQVLGPAHFATKKKPRRLSLKDLSQTWQANTTLRSA
ncbi:hypothetical protein AV530_019495 [Patagioenas fasciata monilis]|uniref:Uncharacterized protein n=1 Tax=Patagioenas fasciata monilis TaxID=372326 RepID=A0A1V4JE36_PATFA|nr:hypothetical protein AV530_019495 [Patagioenas fasciata monilis]